GDLFHQDVRRYREEALAEVAMEAVFPIWGTPTAQAASRFIDLGFRAVLTCTDTTQLSGDFAGRSYDRAFLSDLPGTCDPCGENGEFHTFVFDGPIFHRPVGFALGEKVLRQERFM